MKNMLIEFLESKFLTIWLFDQLIKHKPELDDSWLDVISQYLVNIPKYNKCMFVILVDNLSRISEEYKYITKIHIRMLDKKGHYEKYFYNTLVDVTKKEDNMLLYYTKLDLTTNEIKDLLIKEVAS